MESKSLKIGFITFHIFVKYCVFAVGSDKGLAITA